MPLDTRDAALLHDMRESAQRALDYASGRARSDLDSDPQFSDAVQRRIEIVGEAARGLTEAFRDGHPEIPWRAIMATRHILAHDYDEVNLDIIWRILQDHIPPLLQQIDALLADAPPEPADEP
jgi:uncharacterized protein with HEPN domain